MNRLAAALLCAPLVAACAAQPATAPADLRQQVADVERAFARTMAERDHAAFVSFLAPETVWFAPGDKPLRGRQAVADAWRAFYDKPEPPFSWEPAVVEVLDSGTLALTSGPVRGPDGQQVGTFTSIWRQEAPGVWRVVFDRGCAHCPPRR